MLLVTYRDSLGANHLVLSTAIDPQRPFNGDGVAVDVVVVRVPASVAELDGGFGEVAAFADKTGGFAGSVLCGSASVSCVGEREEGERRTVSFALPPKAMVTPVRMADLPDPFMPTRKLIWGPKLTVVSLWDWRARQR